MVWLLANCTQKVEKALFYRVFTFPFNQGVRSSSLRWSTKIYPKITKNKWFWGIFLSIFDEIWAFLRFFQKILLVCFGLFLFRLLANYSQISEQKKDRLFDLSFFLCYAITSLRVVDVLVNCAAMSGRAFFSPAVSTLEEVTVL